MCSIDIILASDEISQLAKWLTEKLEDDMDRIHRIYTEAVGPVIVARIKERIHSMCDGCQGLFLDDVIQP